MKMLITGKPAKKVLAGIITIMLFGCVRQPGASSALPGNDLSKQLLLHVHYPALALRNHWEGIVVLRLVVGTNGQLESLDVEKSSGYKVLDDAAIQAATGLKLHAMEMGTNLVPVTFSMY